MRHKGGEFAAPLSHDCRGAAGSGSGNEEAIRRQLGFRLGQQRRHGARRVPVGRARPPDLEIIEEDDTSCSAKL
jgi:hypothetical protein